VSQESAQRDGGAGEPDPAKPAFGLPQVVFLATLVGLDFAFGWVAKPLLQGLGLGTFLHLEMIPAVMLLMLARLTVDRFGTLVAYETAWAVVATIAMPAAVVPGPLKLVPFLLQGLVLDAVFSAGRRWPRGRVLAAAVLGGLAGNVCQGLLRLALGLPWARATQVYLGIQLLGGVAVHAVGAWLALRVWERVRDQPAVQWLRTAP
jgi:hypothetical protein